MRPAHRHTDQVAACVTRGRVTVWLGDDFAERIDVETGDYIVLPRMLPHREAAGPQGAELVVAHLATFDTIEVE